jgi:hypothetical protein
LEKLPLSETTLINTHRQFPEIQKGIKPGKGTEETELVFVLSIKHSAGSESFN